MFDIGFSELLLVLVIGLVVLGPERLPVAVRTVAGWIRALRSLAASVQNELSQELKLQELQDSLKKAEKAGLQNLTPELKASMDELKEAADSLKRSYQPDVGANTIHNPRTDEPEAAHDDVITGEMANGPAPAAVAKTTPPTAEAPAQEPVATAPSAVKTPVTSAAEHSPASHPPNGDR